jgi:hypothetical protein
MTDIFINYKLLFDTKNFQNCYSGLFFNKCAQERAEYENVYHFIITTNNNIFNLRN